MGVVSNLEGAKQGLGFFLRNFGREMFVGAVSYHLGVKGSVLADYVGEGLVPQENIWIIPGILITNYIFFALVGIFNVANSIKAGERLGVFLDMKSFLSFYDFARLLSVVHVLEFWFLYGSIAMHVNEWLVAEGAGWSQVILSWINVGVSNAVGDEFAKSFRGALWRVGQNTFDSANVFSFMA